MRSLPRYEKISELVSLSLGIFVLLSAFGDGRFPENLILLCFEPVLTVLRRFFRSSGLVYRYQVHMSGIITNQMFNERYLGRHERKVSDPIEK